ncbi:MAG: metallophosphoesterase family protein [Cyclonatronaceae bacterium]
MPAPDSSSARRLIAIGDIHGCARTLKALLKKLHPYYNSGYTFVFIGDYIDRGPESASVFDILMQLDETESCVFLRGNHEQMMIDALDGRNRKLWMMNGGLQTIASFTVDDFYTQLPDRYRNFLELTRLYFDTPDFFFTHGGLQPDVSVEAQRADSEQHHDFLWERSHIDASLSSIVWEKPVVFGHTPVPEVINDALRLGIDTGCVYHHHQNMGLLTAVVLPERRFVQQEYVEFG